MATIYIPPEDEELDAFSKEVCRRLAQQNDAGYQNRAVVSGLSGFLKLAARIKAKQLNEAGREGFDTTSD